MNVNLKAFLDMIATSEGTINLGDNGYNVIVGGSLFFDYRDHPRKRVWIERIKDWSTAAGRYQARAKDFDYYKKLLNLKGFFPDDQDTLAIQHIRECRALDDVNTGYIQVAINKCNHIWASFPGNDYNQHMNQMDSLLAIYNKFITG